MASSPQDPGSNSGLRTLTFGDRTISYDTGLNSVPIGIEGKNSLLFMFEIFIDGYFSIKLEVLKLLMNSWEDSEFLEVFVFLFFLT